MSSFPSIELGQRILVVGVSGSGKTTLAQTLGRRLDIPHYELDVLHWRPNWTELPLEEMRARLADVVALDAWVIDGNYSRTQDLTLSRVQTVIWLDYPLAVVMWQLLQRTFRRALTGEELWAGNRESLRKAFFSRDSILLWALTSYRRRRRQYTALMADPQFQHIAFIHLRSRDQMRRWLSGVGKNG